MPKKSRLRPGGDERRDSLVRAAFACLAADGFEGLRTRSVADRAGVNIATLHYYFPTKEALIGGVAEFLASQFITLHAPPVKPTGKAALDRLHQEFADAHFYRAEHPELTAVMLELQVRGRRDPAIRKIIEPLFGHWRYGIERFIAGGIEDGAFRSDLDVAGAAALFVSAMIGANNLRLSESELDIIFAAIEAWLMPRDETRAADKPGAAHAPVQPPRRARGKRSGGKS
jgi:TetR/AcrR family transcriptional regulator, regulator of cefoperazone and chloramphenicol sensitivity